jgi:hypothetical protein
MTDHHPDAETVLAAAVHGSSCPCGAWPCRWRATAHDVEAGLDQTAEFTTVKAQAHAMKALAALSAAGLAVVRVGDVPPWMEDGNCVDCGCAWAVFGSSTNGREIYVLKEQP